MDKQTNVEAREYVAGLIESARKAQKVAEGFSQQFVDELIIAVCWDIVKDGPAQEIAKLAVEESRMGTYEAKYAKLMVKLRGALRDMKGQKSVGIIERDDEKGIVKLAKPVGVVGAIVPCTNPSNTGTKGHDGDKDKECGNICAPSANKEDKHLYSKPNA